MMSNTTDFLTSTWMSGDLDFKQHYIHAEKLEIIQEHKLIEALLIYIQLHNFQSILQTLFCLYCT